jgi:hypothetical protein
MTQIAKNKNIVDQKTPCTNADNSDVRTLMSGNPNLTVTVHEYEQLDYLWKMPTPLRHEISERNLKQRAKDALLLHLIHAGRDCVGMLAWGVARDTFPERDTLLGFPEGLSSRNKKRVVRNLFFAYGRPDTYNQYRGAAGVMDAASNLLPFDWMTKFSTLPVLAETLIDKPHRFRHIRAYRESGWFKVSSEDHQRQATYWLRSLDPFPLYPTATKQEETAPDDE